MKLDKTQKSEGNVIKQVDDTLEFGDRDFQTSAEKEANIFESKPRELLAEKETSFNGITIVQHPDGTIIVERGTFG